MVSQESKCKTFVSLHQQSGAFLLPNPWDIGSAKTLQGLGFKALATTSSGLAYTLGKEDGKITLEETLQHCTELAANTNVPVNADFENGFSDSPESIANNILKVVNTGVAGCSIEDFNRDSHRIYDFNLSVERIQAAAEALAVLDIPFLLTARAENLFHGINDLDDTINRLKAFEAAGANVLYAPGICSLEQLEQITTELSQPFNVLASFIPRASVNDFTRAGAKRISTGGALNWAAVTPVLNAGKEMLEQGTFSWITEMATPGEVNKLLS